MAANVSLRDIKLIGDFLNIFSYLLLFMVLRMGRRTLQGISANSQLLFMLALIFRYLTILLDPKDVLSTTQFLKGQSEYGFHTAVKIYQKHNEHYVLFLKAIPMLCSIVAWCKVAFDPIHRDVRRDTFRASYLVWPSIALAFFLNPKLHPKSTQLDTVAILKTASYLIEAVAIVPQLYMHYGGRDPNPPVEEVDSALLDAHFATRGAFRAVYVGCWLYKVAEKGRSSLAIVDNVHNLAGVLQVILYGEIFMLFIRRRLSLPSAAVVGAVAMLLMQPGVTDDLGVYLVGGFMLLQCTMTFVVVQLLRSGMLQLRNPLRFMF